MLRRVYAVVCSLAVLVASAGIGFGFERVPPRRIPSVVPRNSCRPFRWSSHGRCRRRGALHLRRRKCRRSHPWRTAPGSRRHRCSRSGRDCTHRHRAAGPRWTEPRTGGHSAPAAAPAADVVGFDASGLIVYAFGGVGVKMPRSSGEQYQAVRKVQPSAALPGDLLFYGPDGTQSVALFIGNGQMVEVGDKGVAVSPVRTTDMTPYLGRIIG